MIEKINTYLKQFLVDDGDYRDHQGYLVSSERYIMTREEMDELIRLVCESLDMDMTQYKAVYDSLT